MDDSYFMRRAIELAEESSRVRRLLPPYVGAVVVKDGEIVGEGYKQFFSDTRAFLIHAERVALDNTGKKSEGAALYVTLQPCFRTHKSAVFGPCTSLAVERGIKKIVIGIRYGKEEFIRVRGFLRNRGVEVDVLNDGLELERLYSEKANFILENVG